MLLAAAPFVETAASNHSPASCSHASLRNVWTLANVRTLATVLAAFVNNGMSSGSCQHRLVSAQRARTLATLCCVHSFRPCLQPFSKTSRNSVRVPDGVNKPLHSVPRIIAAQRRSVEFSCLQREIPPRFGYMLRISMHVFPVVRTPSPTGSLPRYSPSYISPII